MVNHLLLTPLNFIIEIYIITCLICALKSIIDFCILIKAKYSDIINLYYKVFRCKRAFNKRTNLGKIYLVNIYIINKSKEKLNIT